MLFWEVLFLKYQVGVFPGEKLLKFPDITLQLNEIKKKLELGEKFTPKQKFLLKQLRKSRSSQILKKF